MDVYSRKTVGWMVATRETADLAEALLADTIAAEKVPTAQLTIHSDNGTSMASKTVALLLADLGVVKSHSRPHVSNDNPYSDYAGLVIMPSMNVREHVCAGQRTAGA
jgi:putative transposase